MGKPVENSKIDQQLIQRTEGFIAAARLDEDCARLLDLDDPTYLKGAKGHYSQIRFKVKPRNTRDLNGLHTKVAVVGDRTDIRVDAVFGESNIPYDRLTGRERVVAHLLVYGYELSLN